MESNPFVAVLDTDIGTDVDDVLALTLMARSPELNLIGVTTVYGDTLVRARMARYVCEQLNVPEVVVAPGERSPLSGDNVWWGGHEGQGIPGLDQIVIDEALDGVKYLCDTARSHSGRLNLFAIGPLTNIAKAIRSDPSFASAVHHLYIMGGAYWMKQPEHNIKSDAEAAHVVFSSGIPITVCGLDVTTRVWLREDGVEEIRSALGGFGEVLAQQFRDWLKFMVEHGISTGEVSATHLHDPLAVLSAIRPDLIEFQYCDVTVDLDGDAIGRTRLANCGAGNIRVAADVDSAEAERQLLHLITRPI
jgi:purine nucleosidase